MKKHIYITFEDPARADTSLHKDQSFIYVCNNIDAILKMKQKTNTLREWNKNSWTQCQKKYIVPNYLFRARSHTVFIYVF
jgi:hypothetical protein